MKHVFVNSDFNYLICKNLKKQDKIAFRYLTKQNRNVVEYIESQYSKCYVNDKGIIRMVCNFNPNHFVKDPILYILDSSFITPKILKSWLETQCYLKYFEIVIRITSCVKFETLCFYLQANDDLLFTNRIVFDLKYYNSYDIPFISNVDLRFKRLENVKMSIVSIQPMKSNLFHSISITNDYAYKISIPNCKIRHVVALSVLKPIIDPTCEYEIIIDHYNINLIIENKINVVGIIIDINTIANSIKIERNMNQYSIEQFIESIRIVVDQIQYVTLTLEYLSRYDDTIKSNVLKVLFDLVAPKLKLLKFHDYIGMTYFDIEIMPIVQIHAKHPHIKFHINSDWINYYYTWELDRYSRFDVNISFDRIHIECVFVSRDHSFCQDDTIKYLETQVITTCEYDHLLSSKIRKFKLVSNFNPFQKR